MFIGYGMWWSSGSTCSAGVEGSGVGPSDGTGSVDRSAAAGRGRALSEALERFFAAENARDWVAYATYLHPGVEWRLFDGPVETVVSGRDAYLAAMERAYRGVATQFRPVQILVDDGRNRVVTLLVDDDGERSLDIFDFEDGLVRREWEYLLGAE